MATIEARITKVEHDVGTGWYTILTDHESVKKLTTKMEQKAAEAAALRQGNALALIEYSPKQRHDESTGRTYNNNYYERAKRAEQQAATTNGSGIDVVQQPGRKTDPKDAWRMALTSGSYHAVATLPLMPVEQRDFDTQKTIALAWASWIYNTPPPGETSGVTAQSAVPTVSGSRPGAYDEPIPGGGYEPAPPPGDDDIPF